MACSRTGDHERVRWLLDRGATVNAAQTRNGKTSLMMACIIGYLQVVRVLLGRGANVNAAQTDDGMTSLMWASNNGYLETVCALLKYGANVTLHVLIMA
jgi:ankyrin repeat protein